MASVVGIYNRALQLLGEKRVSSTSDTSPSGKACNACYDACRLSELEAHEWSFAIERAELAADAVAPAWGRANSFTLPSDFIRLAADYPEDNFNSKDWVIEGQKIVSDDADPLYIRYIKDIADPNVMTPLFREALSARMASAMCEEITQSNSKKVAADAEYDRIIKLAKRSNGIQKIADQPPEDTWITVRE